MVVVSVVSGMFDTEVVRWLSNSVLQIMASGLDGICLVQSK